MRQAAPNDPFSFVDDDEVAIDFIDADRTKAAVKVTAGYSGATVQMEKKGGTWIARELSDFWIT